MNIELHKESGNNCFFLEILIKNVKEYVNFSNFYVKNFYRKL